MTATTATIERTSNGVTYTILSPPAKGPAPTLLLFAAAGEYTLCTEPYRRVGALLHARGWNVVSLDLPCHGADQVAGEPAELQGWAARVARGDNPAASLCARVNCVLEQLVKTKVADPQRIAAAGTSRGGFMAFHAAAANPHIRAVAAFSPVTDLLALDEFSSLKTNALAGGLSLTNAVEKLADRAIWITIGDHDQRVDTKRATAFAKALIQVSGKKNLKARVDLHVVPAPGHASLQEWHDQAADWLLSSGVMPR